MTDTELFAAALEKPTSERPAFLADACAGDEKRRRRVEALLRAHAEPDDLLDRPAAGELTGPFRPVTEGPGTVIGPYKLLQKIGEGGFGVVYMAEQERPVRRTVALKIIKPGMDTALVIARFESERQALAIMDHPNIARVFDAGATESGRPYFVMELVKGVPITEFCDKNHMPAAGRLKLFADVCHAIQHAHHKGVIHRDIKPSNVMVTLHDGVPVVKVIDFGVAKATVQKLTEKTLFTAYGHMIGTPAYMSPEQAEMSGLDIDTRSDIYSLGVLLYELLTGTTPLEAKRLREAGYAEMQRLIREEEAPRPSNRLSSLGDSATVFAGNRGTDVEQLSRLLAGDLDWIVMKALEKDRNRRYGTPGDFAADLDRYLRHDAVLARPPSAAYKLAKFARRNRGTVVTAGAVGAALLIGTAVAAWQAVVATKARGEALTALAQTEAAREAETNAKEEAERAKTDALAQAARAEKANTRTREVLDAMVSDATGDSLSTQKEIGAEQKKFLEGVLGYFKEFAAEKGHDESARKRTANAAFRVGMIENQLGRQEQAAAAFTRARDEYETLAADFPAAPEYRHELANSHRYLGIQLDALGQRVKSEAAFRAALAIDEKLATGFPAVPEYRRDLARSHGNLGLLLLRLGRLAESEAAQRAAIAIEEKLAAEFPARAEYRSDLAKGHNNLGALLKRLGKRAETEAAWRAALAINEKLAADFPAVPEYRNNLAMSHNNQGTLLNSLGKRGEAEAAFRAALAVQEKLVADFPAAPGYRVGLAMYCGNLGALLNGLGKRGEADAAFRAALAIQEKLVADFPAVPDYRSGLARSQSALGKRREAEAACRAALDIQQKLATEFPAVPRYRSEQAASHATLGNLMAQRGKLAEAEAEYRAGMAIDEKLVADFPAVPEYRSELAGSHVNLGNLLVNLKKGAEAETALRAGQAIFEQLATDFPAVPEYRSGLARSRANLGYLLVVRGKNAEAEAAYRAGRAIDEKLVADFPAVPEYRSGLAIIHNNLGGLLANLRKSAEAEMEFRAGLAIREKLADEFPAVPEYRVNLGGSYSNLGLLVRNSGKPEESLEWFDKAIRTLAPIHEKEPQAVKPREFLHNSHVERGKAFTVLNRYAEAITDLNKAIELEARPDTLNFFAWLLVTVPEEKLRDPKRAVELAEKAVAGNPADANFHGTLGAARYRAGEWKKAIPDLELAVNARKNDDPINATEGFFLAMADWQLGEKDKAREWFDKSVDWMAKIKSPSDEFKRFRAEAAGLLGVKEK